MTETFEKGQDSQTSDAHKIALELLKQLITLSSGVLALSAAFIENFRPESIVQIAILVISWLLLAGSVFSGLQAISAIVKSRLSPDFDWSEGVGKNYASASKYLFIAGLIAFALFALISFIYSKPADTSYFNTVPMAFN